MTEAIKKLYEIAKKHQVAVRIYIDPRYIFDNPISISVSDGYRKYGTTFTGEMLAGIKDGEDYILTKFEEMCEGLKDGKWDDYTGRRSDS